MRTIALIGCGKLKATNACRARDMYRGNLFRQARAYAESRGWPWLILSAKHGVLDPDLLIEPYDLAMKDFPRAEREHWGYLARAELRRRGLWTARIVFLAGAEYLRAVVGAPRVERPLDGMGIGHRVQWLKRAASRGTVT